MIHLAIIVQVLLLILFGASTASFIQLVKYRVPRGISINRPGSFCEECGKPIKYPYLIPLLGFILTKGKCKICGYKIPNRYFIAELAAGLVFAASYWTLTIIFVGW